MENGVNRNECVITNTRRLRLRPWLLSKLKSNSIVGLEWVDKKTQTFKIPWHHKGKTDYCDQKSQVFKEWAMHTGKFSEGVDEPIPSRWKTNLRCALHKAKDIKEITTQADLDQHSPFRVYTFLKIKSKKEFPIDVSSDDTDLDHDDQNVPTFISKYISSGSGSSGSYQSNKSDAYQQQNPFPDILVERNKGSDVILSIPIDSPAQVQLESSLGVTSDALSKENTTFISYPNGYKKPVSQLTPSIAGIQAVEIPNSTVAHNVLVLPNENISDSNGLQHLLPDVLPISRGLLCYSMQQPIESSAMSHQIQPNSTNFIQTKAHLCGSGDNPSQSNMPVSQFAIEVPIHESNMSVEEALGSLSEDLKGISQDELLHHSSGKIPITPSILMQNDIPDFSNIGIEKLHPTDPTEQMFDGTISNKEKISNNNPLSPEINGPDSVAVYSPLSEVCSNASTTGPEAKIYEKLHSSSTNEHKCAAPYTGNEFYVELVYLNNIVEHWHVKNDKGCVLFYNPVPLSEYLEKNKMYGEDFDAKDHLLMPVWSDDLPNCKSNKISKKATQVLENCDRGIILECSDGSLSITRNCKTSVYSSSVKNPKVTREEIPVKTKIFDFAGDFMNEFQQYKAGVVDKIPIPHVYVYFGQKVVELKPEQILVMARITSCKAMRECTAYAEETHKSTSIHVSIPDQQDELVQIVKRLTIDSGNPIFA